MGFQTIRHRTSAHGHPPGDRPCAFTVIELLAVITILLIMMALIAPALGTFGSSAGRKGAVNILMNTFQQARAAALETGANVYVLLWRRNSPNRDSIMVVREKLDSDPVGAPDPIPLTKWVPMPKGIIFKTLPVKSLANAGVPSDVTSFTPPGKPETGEGFSNRLSGLQFNPYGAVSSPTGDLFLFVTEGVRDQFDAESQVGSIARSPSLERIMFYRFTGRAVLDITDTSDTSLAEK